MRAKKQQATTSSTSNFSQGDEALWIRLHETMNQLGAVKKDNVKLKEEVKTLSKLVKIQEISITQTFRESQNNGHTLGSVLEELRITQVQLKKFQALYHQTEKSLRGVHLHYAAAQHQLRHLTQMLEDESSHEVAALAKRVVQLEGQLYEMQHKADDQKQSENELYEDASEHPSTQTSPAVSPKKPTAKKAAAKKTKSIKKSTPSISKKPQKPAVKPAAQESTSKTVKKTQKTEIKGYESDFTDGEDHQTNNEPPAKIIPLVVTNVTPADTDNTVQPAKNPVTVVPQDNVLKPNLKATESTTQTTAAPVEKTPAPDASATPNEQKDTKKSGNNVFKPSLFSKSK